MKSGKIKKLRYNNDGFSLVELIIVIAIMAVLAASIAPAVIRYIKKSREARAVTEAEAIVNATQSGFAAISSQDYAVNLDKTFRKSNGTNVRCGVVTNLMLKKAQNKGADAVADTASDYSDYLLAIEILDDLNIGSNSNYNFRNFSGSGTEPIGQNCSSFYSQYKCPGVIIIYNDHEQVIMMEYYNNDILVHYEDGEYTVSDSPNFTGSDRIIYN